MSFEPAWRQSALFQAVTLPLLRVLAWVLLTLLGPFRIRHRSRFPRQGGLIILANHLSDLDPVALQLACPRPIYFMAKSDLFEIPVLGSIMRAFRAFPVRRGEPDRGALRRAAALAQAGEVVCLFPEGKLSETGELLPLQPGAELIVRLAKTPVICAGVYRTHKIMPYGLSFPRPAWGWVEVRWGEVRAADAEGPLLAWAEDELRELMK